MIDCRAIAILTLDRSEVPDKSRCRSADRFIVRVDADPLIGSDTVVRGEISTCSSTIEHESVRYEASASIVLYIFSDTDQSSDSSPDSSTSSWYSREESCIREERWYESISHPYEYQYTYEGREDFIHIGYELADFEMSDDSITLVIFPRDK